MDRRYHHNAAGDIKEYKEEDCCRMTIGMHEERTVEICYIHLLNMGMMKRVDSRQWFCRVCLFERKKHVCFLYVKRLESRFSTCKSMKADIFVICIFVCMKLTCVKVCELEVKSCALGTLIRMSFIKWIYFEVYNIN